LKFVKNMPRTDKVLSDQLLSDGWKKIKEPKNLITAILFSIPFMLIAGVVSALVIWYFYNPFEELFGSSFSITLSLDLKTLGYVIAVFALAIIHELIHAAFIPDVIQSKKTCMGLKAYGGFVSTTEIISRGRFILISIAPFLLLSIFLPIVLGVLSLLNGFWVFIIILNAMASCVDLFNMTLILFQTPEHSNIVNNGFETYYKRSLTGRTATARRPFN
jgi:hypothetical protein